MAASPLRLTDPFKPDPLVLKAKFYALKNWDDVADLLQVPGTHLRFWLSDRGTKYREFQIAKRAGGARTINAPHGSTKLLQQRLKIVLDTVYVPRNCVFGFVDGKSVLDNALRHGGPRRLLNVDLEDFFPSIHFGRVRGLFKAEGVGSTAAEALARICCYKGALPQGAPTSPVVSNLICRSLDRRLQELAKVSRCTYTRYVDDITFSTSRDAFPQAIVYLQGLSPVLGDGLTTILADESFKPNLSKVHLRSRRQRMEVTGVVINEFPNVRRRYVRQLHAMLHAWEKFGEAAAEQEFLQRFSRPRGPGRVNISFRWIVRGKLAYLEMIRGENNPVVVKLWNRYAQLVGAAKRVRAGDDLGPALWIVETPSRHGTGFYLEGVGLVTAAHCLDGQPAARIWQLSDPSLKFEVQVLKMDNNLDVAILQPPPGVPLAGLRRGDLAATKVGDYLVWAGYPGDLLGMSPTQVATGVSQCRRRFGWTHLYPMQGAKKGASGSPMLNMQFEVIGIVTCGPSLKDEQAGAGELCSGPTIDVIDELPDVNLLYPSF